MHEAEHGERHRPDPEARREAPHHPRPIVPGRRHHDPDPDRHEREQDEAVVVEREPRHQPEGEPFARSAGGTQGEVQERQFEDDVEGVDLRHHRVGPPRVAHREGPRGGGAGVALVATGVVLLATGGDDQPAGADSAVVLEPLLGPGLVGLRASF